MAAALDHKRRGCSHRVAANQLRMLVDTNGLEADHRSVGCCYLAEQRLKTVAQAAPGRNECQHHWSAAPLAALVRRIDLAGAHVQMDDSLRRLVRTCSTL